MGKPPPGQLRPRDEIELARAAAAAELEYGGSGFVRGALAAYDWVLGHSAQAPASGAAADPTRERIRREEEDARGVLYGHRGAPALTRDFAVGVENALMWIQGFSDNVPVPYE